MNQEEIEYGGDHDYEMVVAECQRVDTDPGLRLVFTFPSGNEGRMEREKLCGRLDGDPRIKALRIRWTEKAAHYARFSGTVVVEHRPFRVYESTSGQA